jgi:hypothetical protein
MKYKIGQTLVTIDSRNKPGNRLEHTLSAIAISIGNKMLEKKTTNMSGAVVIPECNISVTMEITFAPAGKDNGNSNN